MNLGTVNKEKKKVIGCFIIALHVPKIRESDFFLQKPFEELYNMCISEKGYFHDVHSTSKEIFRVTIY